MELPKFLFYAPYNPYNKVTNDAGENLSLVINLSLAQNVKSRNLLFFLYRLELFYRICGRPCLVDIGGVPNLVPLVKRDVYYDLSHLSNWLDMKEGLAIGAGAGPWKYVGVNSELIANFAFGSGTIEKSMSYIAKLDPETEKPIVETLPPGENNCAVLLNLLCSEGKPGKVIKVECKNRKGGLNFVSCMRNAMWKRFPCKFLGLGGVFVIKKGKAKLHIMPDFSEKPLNSDEEVASWLKFVEASSPLTCLSVFVTSDAVSDCFFFLI
ncbi:hypothetical protein QYM36_007410 [Artemia franciscana]|uniref:DUF1907 domain-containing protein n=1 Tax=Artemia franciscana TaxID=6661 RepID=A0AA88HWT0_ARTSF|nr:hypothetical protein QYM36_007410 [Artemia franciscana]